MLLAPPPLFFFNRLIQNDQILLQCSIFPFPGSNLCFQDFNSVCISNLPDGSSHGFYGSLWLYAILEWECYMLLFSSVTSNGFREAPVSFLYI